MFGPEIGSIGADFQHLSRRIAGSTLDEILGHPVSVGVARLSDIVQKDFQDRSLCPHRRCRRIFGRSRKRKRFGGAPQALQIVILPRLGGEDVHQEIAVIRQNPLRLRVPFEADRMLVQFLQPGPDLVGYRLYLLRVRASADNEIVGERGNSGKIQDFNVGSFLGFRGSYCRQPGGSGFVARIFFLIFTNLCQETLPQPLSYYKREPCFSNS